MTTTIAIILALGALLGAALLVFAFFARKKLPSWAALLFIFVGAMDIVSCALIYAGIQGL